MLSVFVNTLIENPAFDSQTKETLTTKPKDFGSKCILSPQFLEAVLEKTRIVEEVGCSHGYTMAKVNASIIII